MMLENSKPNKRNAGVQLSNHLWMKLQPQVKRMRKHPTEAEKIVWQRLRRSQLSGFKFRRQHPIDRFIVDFYCAEAKLAIEVDGPIHQFEIEHDTERQQFIENLGIRVLRFPNEIVLNDIELVIQQIRVSLPHPL